MPFGVFFGPRACLTTVLPIPLCISTIHSNFLLHIHSEQVFQLILRGVGGGDRKNNKKSVAETEQNESVGDTEIWEKRKD